MTLEHHRSRAPMPRRALGALVLLAAVAAPAAAVDLTWSGFGSLGYAASNRDYAWQRDVGDEGTWRRDTLLGVQLDARLDRAWSATLQAKLAPALDHESAWTPSLTWAFLAWRPDNDWLLRAGRLRVPLFLHSETQDVGTTFEAAHLPSEMYALVPTTDFTGLYATRNWAWSARDLSLDAYSGYANTTFRQWRRDGLPPLQPAGAFYTPVRVQSTGLVLTLREPERTLRLGLHATRTVPRAGQGSVVEFPFVTLMPGVGYYQVDDLLPGPGVVRTSGVRNVYVTAGLDWSPAPDWRLSAEVSRVRQFDTNFGADAVSGYVTASRRFGHVTPYVTLGRLLSSSRQRDWVQRLATAMLPPELPFAGLINASQQIAAQSVPNFDQGSIAVGASWALASNLRLKAEWQHVSIGSGTTMANPRPGQALPRETSLDIRSLVLSFDF